jgi:Mn-containing catalase
MFKDLIKRSDDPRTTTTIGYLANRSVTRCNLVFKKAVRDKSNRSLFFRLVVETHGVNLYQSNSTTF